MAWTTLSTVEQLKDDVPILSGSNIATNKLEKIIDEAQDVVYDDLSKIVSWDHIETLDTVPRIINRLAKYQAAAIAVLRNWSDDDTVIGDGPEAQNNIYKLWAEKYDSLLDQIKSGAVAILDDDNDELTQDQVRPLGVGRII